MGYQALLFCPDEKLARVVSQVFTELDFTVDPVQEPFAAVKKLMAQRCDAIVVDCENEQNASLLFKSARNSRSNQSSLAIALVDGQAGVAKAYRIGANLVLTKPINVEQAKGTLRVARGLLRKNSEASSAAPPAKTAPASAGSAFQPASRNAAAIAPTPSRPQLPEVEAPLPAAMPANIPAMAAPAKVEDQPAVVSAPAAQTQSTIAAEPAVKAQPASADVIENDLVKNVEGKNQTARIAAAAVAAPNASSALTPAPGSAAAPAPAKEVPAPPARENKTVESEPANPSHDNAPIPRLGSVGDTNAPTFAALGNESSGRSGSKRILIGFVAILALAALAYLGYGKLGKPSAFSTPPSVSTPQGSGRQPAPALAPMSPPAAGPSTTTPNRASSTTQPSASRATVATPADKPSAGAGNTPAIRTAANPEPEAKTPASTPILVKSNAAGVKTQAHADEPAPPLPSPLAGASANDSNLSGLMSSASPSLPTPPQTTHRISQGLSKGLLIKRVQPTYPPAALAAHAEGAVQIEAIIDKEGNVTNLKVLSGDPMLAGAAVEAVRQWRYKPYYFDGNPVEVETQITVSFKAH